MIRFNLKDHCIETAAKNEYRRLVDEYLKEGKEEIGEKIEFLREFLTTQDFRKIRAERPELSGGYDITVEITKEKEKFLIKEVKDGKE